MPRFKAQMPEVPSKGLVAQKRDAIALSTREIKPFMAIGQARHKSQLLSLAKLADGNVNSQVV